VKEHWDFLCEQVDGAEALYEPKDDDELDSVVAWLLARKWIDECGVVSLGNQRIGSFLVPEFAKLQEAFGRFRQEKGLEIA
jgi:hypothetical protein